MTEPRGSSVGRPFAAARDTRVRAVPASVSARGGRSRTWPSLDQIRSRDGTADPIDAEVQAVVARDHGGELEACRKLLEFGVSQMQGWTGRPIKRGADRLILAEAARATKTFEAVIRLSEAGFGEQGVMLDRSLLEGMAVVHWVSDNRREAVRLFTRHAKYSAVLWDETFDRLGWLEGGDSRAAPSITRKQREEFKRLFGTYGEKPWVQRSLRSSCEPSSILGGPARRDLWIYHDVANRYSNQVLHSTATSAGGATIAVTGHELHMSIGASDQFISQALLPAYWTYGQTLSLLIDVFRFPSKEQFRSIYRPALERFSGGAASA